MANRSVCILPLGTTLCWGLFKYTASEGQPCLTAASCRHTASPCSPAAGLDTVPRIQQFSSPASLDRPAGSSLAMPDSPLGVQDAATLPQPHRELVAWWPGGQPWYLRRGWAARLRIAESFQKHFLFSLSLHNSFWHLFMRVGFGGGGLGCRVPGGELGTGTISASQGQGWVIPGGEGRQVTGVRRPRSLRRNM